MSDNEYDICKHEDGLGQGCTMYPICYNVVFCGAHPILLSSRCITTLTHSYSLVVSFSTTYFFVLSYCYDSVYTDDYSFSF